MDLQATRYTLTKKAALLMFVAITFATLVRPLISELPVILTYLGIINSLISGLLYALLLHAKPRSLYIYLVIVAGYSFIIPLFVLSGGVNSQFAVLLPITPVFVCLLTSARVGHFVGGALILMIIALQIIDFRLAEPIMPSIPDNIAHAKAFWLCMACLISMFFGSQYDRLSTSLGNRLQQQASIDPLTNLLNRRCILEHLKELIDEPMKDTAWISVMMIDVDNFKALNDQYGHLFGDACLTAVAKSLKHSVRNESDFIGRYGGEEFLIVLDGVDQTNTHKVAEKIRNAVEQLELHQDNDKVAVTITIGYCCLPVKDVIDVAHIISLADEALYVGKTSSRNCVVGAEEGQLMTAKITS
ncbi:GGDEF domain-containing protein [Aliiglaciecola litoralis]|uniref:diguanylate cyclase n=1 Tax=Aliiglaciecola litoralis TaxID=582857 RepID=A0ABP3X769_9ALTE